MQVNLEPNFVDKIVNEVKSQGVFDQFRKDSMSDVDTKPAYQNLRQRVENSVSKFLDDQKWTPEMNKNQLREKLRSNLMSTGFLDVGVQRIVDQVVNPKISSIFQPKIEDIVYKYLGIEKPVPKIETAVAAEPITALILNGNLQIKTDETDLLPKDLEAVSPDSNKSDKISVNLEEPPPQQQEMISDVVEQHNELDEDDESPPFEPLVDLSPVKTKEDENSNNSALSGLSGLASQDSNKIKSESTTNGGTVTCEITQESQLSQVSSNSHLSILTNEDEKSEDTVKQISTEERVDISEEAQMPKFNENSNSCPADNTETHHFDIKKDEIKFEGTERNAAVEPNPLEQVELNVKTESVVDVTKNDLIPEQVHSVDEISNATLNTDNSSFFDDDSEKGLQIVEEATDDVSQISPTPTVSSKQLPDNNSPPHDSLEKSNNNSPLETTPVKLEDPISAIIAAAAELDNTEEKTNDKEEKTNEKEEKTNGKEKTEIVKVDINETTDNKTDETKSCDEKMDDNVEISPPPPPYYTNGENKSAATLKLQSKDSSHGRSSSSSSSHNHRKHSKNKKSDKDKERSGRKSTSSSNDFKRNSSSSETTNKHSSSRHSSQSSSRSLPSASSSKDSKDHKTGSSSSSNSSSHKSKHSSRDDKSSRMDRDRKKDKQHDRDDKTKSEKDKTKDDHSLARNKSYRRKSNDSNDGGDKSKYEYKSPGKSSEKNTPTSSASKMISSGSNDPDSPVDADIKTNNTDNNSTCERHEHLSKPVIIENLNNIEFFIGTKMEEEEKCTVTTNPATIPDNNDFIYPDLFPFTDHKTFLARKLNRRDSKNIITTSVAATGGDAASASVESSAPASSAPELSSCFPPQHKKMKIDNDRETEESDLEYFDITADDQKKFDNLMNRYTTLMSKIDPLFSFDVDFQNKNLIENEISLSSSIGRKSLDDVNISESPRLTKSTPKRKDDIESTPKRKVETEAATPKRKVETESTPKRKVETEAATPKRKVETEAATPKRKGETELTPVSNKEKRRNGHRKSPRSHTITNSHKTEENISKPVLNIDCCDYNLTTDSSGEDTEQTTSRKISPTPSELSTGSKENDFIDKNANKTETVTGKNLKQEHKELNADKKLSSSPSVKPSQRYTSDDLYKPRPVLSQRSKRRAVDAD